MASRDDEEFDWYDYDQMGIWEHQGRPLTLRDLVRNEGVLDLPVEVSVYDGVSASAFLTPLHVDFRGTPEHPTGIVITVPYTQS